jgi:hypothetical protein
VDITTNNIIGSGSFSNYVPYINTIMMSNVEGYPYTSLELQAKKGAFGDTIVIDTFTINYA